MEEHQLNQIEPKHEEHHAKKGRKSNYFMLILVGLLLVVSLVQAVQINALDDGDVSSSASKSSYASSGSQPQRAAPSRAAPTMVGGC